MDHANKANVESQRNLKRYQETVREFQMQAEDEARHRDEAREHAATAERRAQALQQEKEDMAVGFEQA